MTSAFGFAGQKCSAASRVIVVDRIYDSFVGRLADATREVVVGHPRSMATRVGPVIDEDSFTRLRAAIERAASEATVRVHRDDVPDGGWFVGPTLVEVDDPNRAAVARDELFGPVVAVLRARDFDHAIELANSTDYALTGGIFSRSPAHIERAARQFRAGNLYINRAGLPPAIPRSAHDHGEHGSPRVRRGGLRLEGWPVVVCPTCQRPVTDADALFCAGCGAPLKPPTTVDLDRPAPTPPEPEPEPVPEPEPERAPEPVPVPLEPVPLEPAPLADARPEP